jgi:hypothetical protein
VKQFLLSLRRAVFFRLTFLEKEIEKRDAEIERLREEVRLLMDTLLASNGLPRLTPRTPEPLPVTHGRMLPSQYRRAMELKSQEGIGEKTGKN